MVLLIGALLVPESFDDDGVRTWWVLPPLPPPLPPLREVPLVVLVLVLLAAMLLLLPLFTLLLLPLLVLFLLTTAPDDVREGFLFFEVGPLLLDMVNAIRYTSGVSPKTVAGCSYALGARRRWPAAVPRVRTAVPFLVRAAFKTRSPLSWVGPSVENVSVGSYFPREGKIKSSTYEDALEQALERSIHRTAGYVPHKCVALRARQCTVFSTSNLWQMCMMAYPFVERHFSGGTPELPYLNVNQQPQLSYQLWL